MGYGIHQVQCGSSKETEIEATERTQREDTGLRHELAVEVGLRLRDTHQKQGANVVFIVHSRRVFAPGTEGAGCKLHLKTLIFGAIWVEGSDVIMCSLLACESSNDSVGESVRLKRAVKEKQPGPHDSIRTHPEPHLNKITHTGW